MKKNKQNNGKNTVKIAPKTDPKPVDKKPQAQQPNKKENPPHKHVEEPVVIDPVKSAQQDGIKIPASKAELHNMGVGTIDIAVRNILDRYQIHPPKDLNPVLVDMYVGANGVVDLMIAESTAQHLLDGDTVILKNLPKDYQNKVLSNLKAFGVTIPDAKQLELPFKEGENGVEISEETKAIAEKEKADKIEADKTDTTDKTTDNLKARIIKLISSNISEKKPFVGLLAAIEEIKLQQTLSAVTEEEKEKIRKESFEFWLNFLFNTINMNLMFVGIGKILIGKIKIDEHPLSAFYFVKNSLATIDKNNKTVYPLSDQDIATLTKVLVMNTLSVIDNTANSRIEMLNALKEKKGSLSESAQTTLDRQVNVIEENKNIVTLMTESLMDKIGCIMDLSSKIKMDKDLTTDEEKAVNAVYLSSTQLFNTIGKEIGIDRKKFSEVEVLAAIHNYAIQICNMFRAFDNQLSVAGNIIVTTVAKEETPAPAEETKVEDPKPVEEPVTDPKPNPTPAPTPAPAADNKKQGGKK